MIYLVLFFAVLLEGPIATLAAATLAAPGTGELAIGPVLLVSVTGNLLADFMWYFLGRFGKDRLPLRLLPGSTQAHRRRIRRVQVHLRVHGLWYFVAAKLSLGLATIPVLLAMGMARIPVARLLPVALVCEIVWTGVLALIGYFGMGPLVVHILKSDTRYLHWIAILGAGIVILVLIYRRRQGSTRVP